MINLPSQQSLDLAKNSIEKEEWQDVLNAMNDRVLAEQLLSRIIKRCSRKKDLSLPKTGIPVAYQYFLAHCLSRHFRNCISWDEAFFVNKPRGRPRKLSLPEKAVMVVKVREYFTEMRAKYSYAKSLDETEKRFGYGSQFIRRAVVGITVKSIKKHTPKNDLIKIGKNH